MLDNTLSSLRLQAARAPADLALRFGVCLRTWHRWEMSNRAPPAVFEVMHWEAHGVPLRGWEGWHVARDGKLYTPGNQGYTPHDIEALPLHLQLIDELRRQLRRLTI